MELFDIYKINTVSLAEDGKQRYHDCIDSFYSDVCN